ncbi:hypothetical protein EJ04DRAFT_581545 [Polyplosphaeria fusca]|uniref:Glycogen debranching enzyme n=1 Tax=Polyplosphaeria fusca TaxID=682080 RepID=A0A9P4QKT1_9PLEO|nr:hypothetical protein EJ04DRAFT_581545 [Polyplosphaeria fusca]
MPSKSWIPWIASLLTAIAFAADNTTCSSNATTLHLTDGPYENYFYSDCHSATHVIITSPLPSTNLTLIGPRLLIAWPAGNSGIVAFFSPSNGQNGTLGIRLKNSTSGPALDPIYTAGDSSNWNASVGVSGTIVFNDSAVLTVPILGSIRTIRDFTEGPSIIYPAVQDAINFSSSTSDSATLNRTWFDNITTTTLSFTPLNGSDAITLDRNINTTLTFAPGTYRFNASFNYPQLTQLSPQAVLNNASTDLIQQSPDQTTSLSFLSYTDKLLAGTWRFLTYFGRDSMISLLLLQPILSPSATEAVLASVIERINATDGSACHEEVLGDYATWLNLQKNVSSTQPGCDYKMVDTDFFVPIVLKGYFVDTDSGRGRAGRFFNRTAGFLEENAGKTYEALALRTAEKIVNTTAAFAAEGGQKRENLIHLKDGEVVGQWRDSTYGIGGGRAPYDVNTALVPAALRAIAALSRAGLFPSHPDWNSTADAHAQIWEDESLSFFEVSVPRDAAKQLVDDYTSNLTIYSGPSHSEDITENVLFYALALDGNDGQDNVRVMNTDDCFRHFLLNTTNQTQLTGYLNQTADHVLQPWPVGLSSDVGLFVANPAYGGAAVYARNFTNADYHGTVVWSWQLAMMAAGLARQLGRCDGNATSNIPDFCEDGELYAKVLRAYNHLWTLIDANGEQLSGEVWSWTYDDGFHVEPLGSFTPTESDIRQLWSLTFLAVHRENFRQSLA